MSAELEWPADNPAHHQLAKTPNYMLEDIKKTLWATADKLRANRDAAEYKHLVLGLIFVKYISDTFAARLADPKDEYFFEGATPETLSAELEDRDYYKSVNVFWVPEAARWESLRAAAKQSDIGKRIDEALTLVEVENPKLKGILDKRYARAQFARRQARRTGGLDLNDRLWRQPLHRARHSGPGVLILFRHVRQRRGQTRRAVLHPGQHC